MSNRDYWIHCKECGRNRLHGGRGLCKQCYMRQWRADHSEHKVEYDHKWRNEHPEYHRRWRKANPEKVREYDRRRARKASASKIASERRWVHCVECNRNRLHKAHGLCKQCYNRQWRGAHPGYFHQWHETHPEYGRQWAEANPERKQELNRQWREENPEHKAEYDSKWREANPGYFRQWHEAHPEYNRQWAEANPERVRETGRRRRARKANATIGPVDEAAIYERDGYACVYCGSGEDLTLDHIVPLAHGGMHCEDNLVVACRSCNSSKGATSLEDWLQTQPQANAWLY